MIQPTWGRTARPRSSRIGTKNDFSVSPGRTEEPWTTRPLGCTLVTRASKRGVSRLSSSFASHCITDSGIAGGSDHHELPVSEMDDESLCWGALPPGAIHSRGAGGGIGDCSGEGLFVCSVDDAPCRGEPPNGTTSFGDDEADSRGDPANGLILDLLFHAALMLDAAAHLEQYSEQAAASTKTANSGEVALHTQQGQRNEERLPGLPVCCVRACVWCALSQSLSLWLSRVWCLCELSIQQNLVDAALFLPSELQVRYLYGPATAKRGEAGVVHTRKATARRLGPRLHVRGQRRLSKSTTQSETQPLLPCTVLKALKPWV